MKIALLVGLVATSLLAAELPEPVIPAGVAVNIHFTTGHQADLDKIKEGGFKFIRMDFGWGGIERKKGEYDWSAYDELTANLEQRGLRPYYILDYSNPLYEEATASKNPLTGAAHRDTASPQHPASVAAFAQWAAAAAKHFKGRHVVWEFWNEPNIDFWKPKPDAQQYADLVLAAGKAIREADLEATLVGPATSTFPWKFIEVLFASGALQYLDAVSVHPYRGGPPETAAADYLKLRGLIARYAPAGKENLPILSGEWGYPTHNKGVSLETQAAYLVRQQLANLWSGVPLSVWYDWKNDGLNPSYNEDNFGTVTTELKPKPSYESVQALTRQLSGYRLVRRLATPNPDDFALLCFDGSRRQKVVVWTTGTEHELSLDLGLPADEALAAVSARGEPFEVKTERGRVQLTLKPAPAYLTLSKPVDRLSAAGSWQASLPGGALVKAGAGKTLRVGVRIQNPFSRSVRVGLDGQLEPGGEPIRRQLQLKGGEILDHTLELPVVRRDAETGHAMLHTVWQDAGDGSLLGESTERLSFVLANPLELSIAPVETGWRLQIQNPAAEPFTGSVRVAGATHPVSLRAGQSSATLDLAEAKADSGLIGLFEDKGGLVAELRPGKYRRAEVEAFRAVLDGDSKIEATASIVKAAAPGEDKPYAEVFKLDYHFAEGWRFVRCVPEEPKPATLGTEPKALGVWVYGDNSGNSLCVRLVDTSGQTFQYAGPKLDWSGWRSVRIELGGPSKASGHWGGANDNTIHGTLRWDCPLLLDSRRAAITSTIYFAGVSLIE